MRTRDVVRTPYRFTYNVRLPNGRIVVDGGRVEALMIEQARYLAKREIRKRHTRFAVIAALNIEEVRSHHRPVSRQLALFPSTRSS